MPKGPPLGSRLVLAPSGCLEWTGPVTYNGYGRAYFDGRSQFVHRITYELVFGPVPAALELDHLCRNRTCARPDHLEAVSHRENNRRGRTITAVNIRKTACPHDHPFDSENTYRTPDGRRNCRTCRAEATRRYLQRKKVA